MRGSDEFVLGVAAKMPCREPPAGQFRLPAPERHEQHQSGGLAGCDLFGKPLQPCGDVLMDPAGEVFWVEALDEWEKMPPAELAGRQFRPGFLDRVERKGYLDRQIERIAGVQELFPLQGAGQSLKLLGRQRIVHKTTVICQSLRVHAHFLELDHDFFAVGGVHIDLDQLLVAQIT